MGPVRVMAPSNHSSQLILQLGRMAVLRSTMMNLGCITLKGRRKMDLISRFRPWSSDGSGRPSFCTHVDGGYVWPVTPWLWKSFWNMELEEKQSRTLIFCVPRITALVDSFLSTLLRMSKLADLAQKQVTRMSSWSADSRRGAKDSYMDEPVPVMNVSILEVVMRDRGYRA